MTNALLFCMLAGAQAVPEVDTHLREGAAWMAKYVPGAQTPESRDAARNAESEFQRALALDPRNRTALTSLGSLAWLERRFEQAKDWYERLLAVAPASRDGHYWLGVIAWTEAHQPLQEARVRSGMRAGDPGPIPNLAVRQDLRGHFGSSIQEAIGHLDRALEIDPAYDDAMAYVNLLYRQRAALAETREDALRDVAAAGQCEQKALDTKRAKAASAPRGRVSVAGNGHDSKLLHRVDPIYPPLAREARIQGSVRMTIVIGKDGRVSSIRLISGHPLLVPAATEAVKQWVYRPTILNGEPVEVITEITLNFVLPSPPPTRAVPQSRRAGRTPAGSGSASICPPGA